MRHLLAFLLAILFYSGCQTVPLRTKYDPVGYKPKNPGNVTIKVSLQNRMVYVVEGSRPLLITATAIGLPNKPTPKGRFRVTNKIANKRSGSYGFWVKGDTIVAGKSSQAPGGGYRYIGFPMQYWVEWMPGYGFHVGSVWPVPRTHGCLRLEKTPHVNFSNSPALALRSILRKHNPRTPRSARTLLALTITTILIRRKAS